MESIKYSSPEEAARDGELPEHRFDLMLNGNKIGAAEVDYYSKPLPLYQVSLLYVDAEHKGKGYASQIMDQVEQWLISRKKPGVLVDAIMEDDPAKGMYLKRGWTEVPGGGGLHVFNWPEAVDLSILQGYPFRYTDIEERKNAANTTEPKLH